MRHTVRSDRGMVTAPHHLAAQAGLDVLRDGGTAANAQKVASCAGSPAPIPGSSSASTGRCAKANGYGSCCLPSIGQAIVLVAATSRSAARKTAQLGRAA